MGGGKGEQPAPTPEPAPFTFEMPQMPEFKMPEQQAGPDYAAQLATQQAEQARTQGIAERDRFYGSYMDAAGAATDYVTGEISREQSNARLLGIDYQITDEMKNRRISDYFASIWGEGEQAQLESSMEQWGKPKGFEEFAITRGDAATYGGERKGAEETVGATKGVSPRTLVTEEEETLGTTSVLGV